MAMIGLDLSPLKWSCSVCFSSLQFFLHNGGRGDREGPLSVDRGGTSVDFLETVDIEVSEIGRFGKASPLFVSPPKWPFNDCTLYAYRTE